MAEDGDRLWLGTENGLSRIPFDAVPLPLPAATVRERSARAPRNRCGR